MSNQYVKDTLDIDRFLSKVEITEGCWNWSACTFGDGYGAFYFEGNNVRAHRFSYEHFIGPIASDLLVCHSCDNRLCVNPDHLYLGTSQDNMDDKVAKGRESHGGGIKSCLSSDDVEVIRHMHDSWGLPDKNIADIFGLSSCYINKIVNRKRL